MDAKELRIGNFVRGFDDRSYEHQEIQFLSTRVETTKGLYYKYENVNPIPITEEWLERFGFKKDKSWFGEFYENKEGDSVNSDITVITVFDTGDFDMPKYIHQLQNLYFALTGKELGVVK